LTITSGCSILDVGTSQQTEETRDVPADRADPAAPAGVARCVGHGTPYRRPVAQLCAIRSDPGQVAKVARTPRAT